MGLEWLEGWTVPLKVRLEERGAPPGSLIARVLVDLLGDDWSRSSSSDPDDAGGDESWRRDLGRLYVTNEPISVHRTACQAGGTYSDSVFARVSQPQQRIYSSAEKRLVQGACKDVAALFHPRSLSHSG